jgi:hypothetical protein
MGGLVIIRHNEIADELANLASKALTPSAVRDEPSIYPHGRAAAKVPAEETRKTSKSPVNRPKSSSCDEDRGDLLIRGLWARGTDCIIDVRVTDLDCKSNLSKDPHKVLAQHERAKKKKKYLEACTEQRRHFSPFAVSTDGVISKEARALLGRLSALLAEKWDQPYSVACGYVNAGMSITIARATHLCLRGSRVPTGQMSNRRPQWEDSAGLSLFRD